MWDSTGRDLPARLWYSVTRNRREPASLAETITSKDRRQAANSAPPQGLCLMEVYYGEKATDKASASEGSVTEDASS
jgi:tRNA U38,U39,U40 pseudouridine synthase TruA